MARPFVKSEKYFFESLGWVSSSSVLSLVTQPLKRFSPVCLVNTYGITLWYQFVCAMYILVLSILVTQESHNDIFAIFLLNAIANFDTVRRRIDAYFGRWICFFWNTKDLKWICPCILFKGVQLIFLVIKNFHLFEPIMFISKARFLLFSICSSQSILLVSSVRGH